MTDVNLGLFKPDKSLLHLNRGEVLNIEPPLGLKSGCQVLSLQLLAGMILE